MLTILLHASVVLSSTTDLLNVAATAAPRLLQGRRFPKFGKSKSKVSSSNSVSTGPNGDPVTGSKRASAGDNIDPIGQKSSRAEIKESTNSETDNEVEDSKGSSIGSIFLLVLGLLGTACSVWLVISGDRNNMYAYLGIGIISEIFVLIGAGLLLRNRKSS
jgi:hypothetical protein